MSIQPKMKKKIPKIWCRNVFWTSDFSVKRPDIYIEISVITDIISTFWIYDLKHIYIALKLCKQPYTYDHGNTKYKQPYTNDHGNTKYVNIILHFCDIKLIY